MCFGGGNVGVAKSATDPNTGKVGSGRVGVPISEEMAPRNSALDDLKMDLGIKPKNVAYYRDLPERQSRSKEAMKALMAKANESDDRPAPAPTPTPEVKPVAEAPEVPQAPSMTTAEVQAPLKEEEVGVGTAASGEAEAAQIEAEAGGEAEKKVAGTAKTSRRSTVQTSAQGLLTEAPTRKRRALMNKMIA